MQLCTFKNKMLFVFVLDPIAHRWPTVKCGLDSRTHGLIIRKLVELASSLWFIDMI